MPQPACTQSDQAAAWQNAVALREMQLSRAMAPTPASRRRSRPRPRLPAGAAEARRPACIFCARRGGLAVAAAQRHSRPQPFTGDATRFGVF
eukprot:2404203-Prymnesium_polylepis.1